MILLYKNGSAYSRGSFSVAHAALSFNFGSTYSDLVYLAAGEYIDMRIFHNQGAAVNVLSNALSNYFSVHRLS